MKIEIYQNDFFSRNIMYKKLKIFKIKSFI